MPLRITGLYQGTEYTILEYEHGIVECPMALATLLAQRDHSLPTGEALLVQCQVLFGATMRVEDEA